MPIFIGSSSYTIGQSEALFAAALGAGEAGPLPVPSAGFGQLSRHLQTSHGLSGADYLFNTACTSSANALLIAAEHILAGYCEQALVIGMELFNVTTLAGFYGMQLLANEVMRPFDRRRDGLVLGEGCGAILLQAAGPDDNGLFVSGGASGCDTYSISTSNPDGTSNAEVMTQALNNVGLAPGDITAIKAHGSASPLNDDAEAAGMRRVFNEPPPFFVLKPYVGHTLGACGTIETILVCAAIREGFLPASGGFEIYDDDLGVHPMTAALNVDSGHFMLNYFGFGGNNASILLSHEADDV
jgi:3-oxoacyl-[acyl-carrier-protein] synthase-1